MSPAFMRFLRQLHKWLGLIVGLQLLLWTESGLVFAFLDHHQVRGEHSTRSLDEPLLPRGAVLAEPTGWLADHRGEKTYEVRLQALLDHWVWRIEVQDRVELRSAESGARFVIDQPLVERLASVHYAGAGRLQSVAFQKTSGLETRNAGSVWQARFDDPQQTTLYFSAEDGRLVQARNATWRLFDVFWMLHTMDYEGRDDFNNPLVITVATATLWLTLSGLLLLLKSFRRQDFDFLRPGRSR